MNIDNEVLSALLAGATHAQKMVEMMAGLVEPSASLPDDMTIVVMHRKEAVLRQHVGYGI